MTKNSRKASEWRGREIEADGAGYVAAQKVEREDRAAAEKDELVRAPGADEGVRITAEDLHRARGIGHGLWDKDD